jgi:hypothetical protein
MTIDPTLKLDVLAKMQTLEVTGTHRSIFDFSQAPPPKPDPTKPGIAKVKPPTPIVPVEPPKPQQTTAEAPKPTPPAVGMKFFGYVSPRGDTQKRAFFMDGEEIHIVREGDIVKRRYRIVRIGVNSVTVEDQQFPGSSLTVPLEEQPG